jgi:hypothetical protein
MSTFAPQEVACPSCGRKQTWTLATSLNGARASKQIDEIKNGSFQQVACDGCGHRFELEWPFLYYDFAGSLTVGVFPSEWEPEWRRHEAMLARSWRKNAGADAPLPARSFGAGVRVRTVFGHAALREKLLCSQAGLDDRLIELLKLELMRAENIHVRLRLQAIDGDFAFGADGVAESWRIPRSAYDELAAQPADYAQLLSRLDASSYVDLGAIAFAG